MDLGIWNADRIHLCKNISGTVFAYSQRKEKGICDAPGLLCSGTSSGSGKNAENLMAMILLTLSVFTVLSYGNIFVRERNLCLMIAGFLIAGILFNIAYQYSYEKDYLSEFTDSGEALEKLETGVDLAVLDTRMILYTVMTRWMLLPAKILQCRWERTAPPIILALRAQVLQISLTKCI